MKKHLTLGLSLLMMIALLAACGPADEIPVLTATQSAPSVPPVATEPPAPIVTEAPQQVATEASAFVPRGPNLEASDPTTVNLASGTPALVEFFAFW